MANKKCTNCEGAFGNQSFQKLTQKETFIADQGATRTEQTHSVQRHNRTWSRSPMLHPSASTMYCAIGRSPSRAHVCSVMPFCESDNKQSGETGELEQKTDWEKRRSSMHITTITDRTSKTARVEEYGQTSTCLNPRSDITHERKTHCSRSTTLAKRITGLTVQRTRANQPLPPSSCIVKVSIWLITVDSHR